MSQSQAQYSDSGVDSEGQSSSGLLKDVLGAGQQSFLSSEQDYSYFRLGEQINQSKGGVQVVYGNQQKKIPQKPTVGSFSLDTFLLQAAQGGLGLQTVEEQSDEDSNEVPQILNSAVIEAMKLSKIGQATDIEMSFQEYMRSQSKNNKNKFKTKEQRIKQHEFFEDYGVGFKMMAKMGFTNVTKGLGKAQSGITAPVQAIHKKQLKQKDRKNIKLESQDSESNSQQVQEQSQIPAHQQLFNYKSSVPKINNFLLDLKTTYQDKKNKIIRLRAKTVQGKKQNEIFQSLVLQKQSKLNEVRSRIHDLQQALSSLQKNSLSKVNDFKGASFLLQHKVDYAHAQNLHAKLLNISLQQVKLEATPLIKRVKQILSQIYLNKQRQMIANITKKQPEIVQIPEHDQQHIANLIGCVVDDTLLSKVYSQIQRNKFQHISLTVVDVLEVCRTYSMSFQVEVVNKLLVPKLNKYLQNYHKEDKLPHLVIFPWITVIPNSKIQWKLLVNRLMTQPWTINNSQFFKVIDPLFKFMDNTAKKTLLQLYLAPRLLRQMQEFQLANPAQNGNQDSEANNKQKMKGLLLYTQFLDEELKAEIVKQTIVTQIIGVYHNQKGQQGLQLWLKNWQRTVDKISKGLGSRLFRQFGILVI